MFTSKRTGANAYAAVGLETGVFAATPHKLVVMLFDGAIAATILAGQHLAARNIAEKSAAINKAANIIESGLRTSLNRQVGGELAGNLDSLYAYLSKRLLQANLENNGALLDEVLTHLRGLRDAWNAIDPQQAGKAAGHAGAAQPIAGAQRFA